MSKNSLGFYECFLNDYARGKLFAKVSELNIPVVASLLTPGFQGVIIEYLI